ncbi:MAG: heme o synthase [Archaeoglobaceae archaeon]|nr:heme o synthase [Archaeoglobaceae archaeon]MDW8118919.1 heme o synthase [Archaeoglobaceae archaeon]
MNPIALLEVIKPKQTLLLMITFLVSFLVAGGREEIFLCFIATFLTISGTTALNMFLDRDIDALMMRTRKRPIPAGELSPRACAIYGSTLFSFGFLIALMIKFEFAFILLLGFIFDILVYTLLLKRKSPYSIILGGVAGAMPALAGWVAVKGFTLPGFLISALVFLWIPSHIWFIAMHYEEDYRKAKIPMYPLVAGIRKASWVIVFTTSSMLLLIIALYFLIPLSFFYLFIAIPAILIFLFKAIKFAIAPKKEKAREMYKLASLKLGAIFLGLLFGAFL